MARTAPIPAARHSSVRPALRPPRLAGHAIVAISLLLAGIAGRSAAAQDRVPTLDAFSVREGFWPAGVPGWRAKTQFDPQRLYIRETLDILLALALRVDRKQLVAKGSTATQLENRWFDVTLTSTAPATRDQLLDMLRTGLVERFHLKYRLTFKTMDVDALVVGKGGPRFQALGIADPGPIAQPGELAGDNIEWLVRALDTMGAAGLGNLHRHVIDRTGLRGRYAIRLRVGKDGLRNLRTVDFPKLLQTLGLAITPMRAPYEYVVIDSLSGPDRN